MMKRFRNFGRNFKRSLRAISPVIAVLLMIAIAVAASLVAYAWVMGYLSFTTSKVGNAVQVHALAVDNGNLVVYVQNVGQNDIEFKPDGSLYVNDEQKTILSIDKNPLEQGKTATIIADYPVTAGEPLKVKIVTADGTFTEISNSKGASIPSSVTLTLNPTTGGSITANPDQPSYTYGTEVTLTATPDPGYSFDSWSGHLTGNNTPETIIMNGDKTITATFTQNEYTLTLNIVGSGSISSNPNQPTYHYGDSVQITANPNTYWHFSGWSGDLSGSTNPTTILIDGDKTVTATFTENSAQTLTLRPNADGSVDDLRNSAGSSDSNNWRFVDESSADGHSTYVYDQDQGDQSSDVDTYNIQNHGSASDRINSVTVRVRCIKYGTDSDRSYARTALRVGSTVYVGNRNTLGSSWTVYSTTYSTKPGGGSWTWSDIDSLQAGVRLASGDTSGGYSSLSIARCTQVWVEVNHTPP